ncbi:serine protease [Saccharothrix violaceirubra]|uniref:Trypsin-like peptidase n=1 Tax=Saccharothrix violaceirubra TaxID=413306 RepID=A0A7W7T7G0_9PSEU|nr:trypsin-like peptidase domain-containing protein [Saccharothrix violaceirubra]MBB4966660.1 hypothetical protein [Saccharothrix violaceirubra]
MVAGRGGPEPWRLRLVDGTGSVLGAGVQLGTRHVLTCAHAVFGLAHTLAGRVGAAPVAARVVPGWWVPPGPDGRGDVAVLELDEDLPAAGAVLRRTALSFDRLVHTYGYPDARGDGVWARLHLAGRTGPGAEWLEMRGRTAAEPRLEPGFHGGGVVDDRTGAVLGIVVKRDRTDGSTRSWLSPVETIVAHVPDVARWVTGESAADKVFSDRLDPAVELPDVARALADWLDRAALGDLVITVAGADRHELYRLVSRADRESRRADADRVGGIDLAVDASGRTPEEVARRVVARTGIDVEAGVRSSDLVRAGVPAMTVVVDAVDDATDPEALLADVLRPLAAHGTRLVLGYRRASSPALDAARAWEVDQRLGCLSRWITRGGRFDERTTGLRRRVTAIRGIVREFGVEKARDRLDRLTARVAALPVDPPDERRELRGLLEAYQAKAHRAGLAEDPELTALYRVADHALAATPFDPGAAGNAVREYGLAVGRRADP